MSRTAGNWNEYISSSNTNEIWKQLNRIVGQHRLSRFSTKFDQLVEEGNFNRFTDFTQELFLNLLEKDRFTHYLATEMTDSEIEMEISQIELTNVLTLHIKKRYPEAYRISRRILMLLQKSDSFKVYSAKRGQRVSDHYYGLSSWTDRMLVRSLDQIEFSIEPVKHVTRNNNCAGRACDSQIIISTKDLEALLIDIFQHCYSPLTVKQIRQYAMSRITILDLHVAPLELYITDEDRVFEIADSRNTPEQDYNDSAADEDILNKLNKFLQALWKKSNEKQKRYDLTLNILRYYYLTPGLSQWDVSKILEVSDSLISSYRKTIDASLQDLKFLTVREAKLFQSVLSLSLIEGSLDNNKLKSRHD